jgi:hypothetical protein
MTDKEASCLKLDVLKLANEILLQQMWNGGDKPVNEPPTTEKVVEEAKKLYSFLHY